MKMTFRKVSSWMSVNCCHRIPPRRSCLPCPKVSCQVVSSLAEWCLARQNDVFCVRVVYYPSGVLLSEWHLPCPSGVFPVWISCLCLSDVFPVSLVGLASFLSELVVFVWVMSFLSPLSVSSCLPCVCVCVCVCVLSRVCQCVLMKRTCMFQLISRSWPKNRTTSVLPSSNGSSRCDT